MKRLRGPLLREAYLAARKDLAVLMDASLPLADCALRLVERVDLDSLTGVSRVAYRDMMGDHSLVPSSTLETTQHLESGSLYLVDRDGVHHLLRPVLLRDGCATCGHEHTFVFDKFVKPGVAVYRAMEDGHVIERTDQEPALRDVGLPP